MSSRSSVANWPSSIHGNLWPLALDVIPSWQLALLLAPGKLAQLLANAARSSASVLSYLCGNQNSPLRSHRAGFCGFRTLSAFLTVPLRPLPFFCWQAAKGS